jgi:hypothetical protein
MPDIMAESCKPADFVWWTNVLSNLHTFKGGNVLFRFFVLLCFRQSWATSQELVEKLQKQNSFERLNLKQKLTSYDSVVILLIPSILISLSFTSIKRKLKGIG